MVSCRLGRIEYATVPLQAYPNPTRGGEYVRVSGATAALRVFDGTGQLVRTQPAPAAGAEAVLPACLPAGFYLPLRRAQPAPDRGLTPLASAEALGRFFGRSRAVVCRSKNGLREWLQALRTAFFCRQMPVIYPSGVPLDCL